MLRMTNDYKEEKITTMGKLGNLKFENMPRLLLLQKKIVELFLASKIYCRKLQSFP